MDTFCHLHFELSSIIDADSTEREVDSALHQLQSAFWSENDQIGLSALLFILQKSDACNMRFVLGRNISS